MRAGEQFTGTIHGRFPARLEEIRYRRTADHPGWYKHGFTSATDMFALTDGGLLIRPRNPGGFMGTPRLWLDNRPRKHHKKHHHGHHHNPYLAAYNPSVMALAKSYVSMPAAMTYASGAAGFAGTYLGYKALFSLTALSTYGADPGYTGVIVRTLGRIAIAAAGNVALARFVAGHNRMAYIGGSAAYIGLALILEALGYQVTVGAGQPLVTLLPAALQPTTTVAGVDAFVQRPRRVAGMDAFVQRRLTGGFSGLGMHPSKMYANRLSPA